MSLIRKIGDMAYNTLMVAVFLFLFSIIAINILAPLAGFVTFILVFSLTMSALLTRWTAAIMVITGLGLYIASWPITSSVGVPLGMLVWAIGVLTWIAGVVESWKISVLPAIS